MPREKFCVETLINWNIQTTRMVKVLDFGSRVRPCLRLMMFLSLLTFLTIFYFFSDVSSAGYMKFFRRNPNLETDFYNTAPGTWLGNRQLVVLKPGPISTISTQPKKGINRQRRHFLQGNKNTSQEKIGEDQTTDIFPKWTESEAPFCSLKRSWRVYLLARSFSSTCQGSWFVELFEHHPVCPTNLCEINSCKPLGDYCLGEYRANPVGLLTSMPHRTVRLTADNCGLLTSSHIARLIIQCHQSSQLPKNHLYKTALTKERLKGTSIDTPASHHHVPPRPCEL
ncbi:hypothetical protein J6590_039848 [Homalodisca vitripennis]|nr:hypothetical protein J6590_039848 [Homalodisca vitripennis]